MKSVNVHDAKTHFSRLLDDVAEGDSIVIAKAGRPVAKLVPLDAVPVSGQLRTGFLHSMTFPADFDTMAETEIAALFGNGA